MACEVKKDGTGAITAIICSRGRSLRRCVHCGGRADLLCDFPVLRDGVRGTCDASLCGRCSKKTGGGDLCRPHAVQWDEKTGKPKIGPAA
jgi:hypothetical protein